MPEIATIVVRYPEPAVAAIVVQAAQTIAAIEVVTGPPGPPGAAPDTSEFATIGLAAGLAIALG